MITANINTQARKAETNKTSSQHEGSYCDVLKGSCPWDVFEGMHRCISWTSVSVSADMCPSANNRTFTEATGWCVISVLHQLSSSLPSVWKAITAQDREGKLITKQNKRSWYWHQLSTTLLFSTLESARNFTIGASLVTQVTPSNHCGLPKCIVGPGGWPFFCLIHSRLSQTHPNCRLRSSLQRKVNQVLDSNKVQTLSLQSSQ